MSEIAQPRSSDERCDAKGDIGQFQSPALLEYGTCKELVHAQCAAGGMAKLSDLVA